MNPVPVWVTRTTFVLSILGLGISTYLTIAHFVGVQSLACSDNSFIDCAEVTTSAESHILGVPVAVLGLVQYVAMTVLTSPFGWARPERVVHLARLALATVGACFVLWLISAELLIIGKICLWCSGVHLVTLALFLLLARFSPAQLGWGEARD